MNHYPAVKNILASAYSVETGLDDDAAIEMYRRNYNADPNLRDEVRRAFQDSSICWREMLCNSDYEVFEADSEAEASEIAEELLVQPIEGL